ncbi:MAG: hypothetical protein IJI68_06415 [Eggerthellaceae bacterium]|nr:hypothetical protein [Eggerthellaceae bacterium]
MASQDIVQQLVNSVVANPQLMGNLAEHPYSTVSQATGQEEVSRDEVSEALAAVAALANGQQIDFGNLASIAASLLADNGGSAHALAQSLFGEPVAVSQSTATEADPIADMIGNLANVAFGQGVAGVNLSDGIGLDDVIGLAGAILGGKK